MTEHSRKTAAARRVARISALFDSIADTLEEMIATLGTTGGPAPRAIALKLQELQTAHLKVIAAEEAFHAAAPDSTADDIEAIRGDIGCKIDRIRAALDAAGVPRQSE